MTWCSAGAPLTGPASPQWRARAQHSPVPWLGLLQPGQKAFEVRAVSQRVQALVARQLSHRGWVVEVSLGVGPVEQLDGAAEQGLSQRAFLGHGGVDTGARQHVERLA